MSIYSTLYIDRERAEKMVRDCRNLEKIDDVSQMSLQELDEELHKFVYSNENSNKYTDIVGYANNYIIN